MICPHCQVANRDEWTKTRLKDSEGQGTNFYIRQLMCLECNKHTIYFDHYFKAYDESEERHRTKRVEKRVYPDEAARKPIHPSVPEGLANDYTEACLVLPISPKASAALSRRCLQLLIHKEFNIDKGYLWKEIKELRESGQLPEYIAKPIDEIRKLGNYAAHPNEDEKTGEIIDIEPQEADWLLEIIEDLFDHCYAKPAETKKRMEAVKEKYEAQGKDNE